MAKFKHLREFQDAAVEQGWTVTIRKGGHVCFQRPDGYKYFTGATPSDRRAAQNLRADLRRAGLQLPRRGAHRAV